MECIRLDGKFCKQMISENAVIGLPKGTHNLVLKRYDKECSSDVFVTQQKEYVVPITCP